MWLLIVALIVVIALLVLANLLFPKRARTEYIYRKKEYFLTQAERNCFNVLMKTVGEQYYVFPQIHLAAILDHKIHGQNWWGAFRHIDEKSVDFVLCDKEKLSPTLAIELDDWSHERQDRKKRDREVERILKNAGVPLLRLSHDFIGENLATDIQKLLVQ